MLELDAESGGGSVVGMCGGDSTCVEKKLGTHEWHASM